jgi:hypothetical protein
MPGRPLDEAEAILRDLEGEAALHELWAIAAQNRQSRGRTDQGAAAKRNRLRTSNDASGGPLTRTKQSK